MRSSSAAPATAPSALVVDEDGARLEPAGDLWGLSAAAAEEALRARLGPAYRVAAIGPAGEQLVRFATVSHDGRHAGRGGLGAVMGSKLLKAIAVRAHRRAPVHDPAGGARRLEGRCARAPSAPRPPSTARPGTLSNLLTFNALSALPGHNFGAETTELALEDRAAVRDSCASCSIGCERILTTKSGGSARVEYESAFALGPLVGIGDADAVLEAVALADELGVDTISAGGTIAWAMDCGLAPWLRFGDAAGRAARAARDRRARGARRPARGGLARGVARTPAIPDRAMHVKGLELPGYEPRTLHAMALGLAVNARGADHNRSGAYEADLSGELDRLDGGAAHVAAAIETEDRAAAMDSLILCKFLRGVFSDPWEEWAALLAPVTGWDIDGSELHETARGIVGAKHAYNRRQGWTPAEDTLPPRLLGVPLTLPSGREAVLTRERLDAMVLTYHREPEGWTNSSTTAILSPHGPDGPAQDRRSDGDVHDRRVRGRRSRRARRSTPRRSRSASRSRCSATTSATTPSASAACAPSTRAGA